MSVRLTYKKKKVVTMKENGELIEKKKRKEKPLVKKRK
jgi:hypothetical protein